VFGGIKALLNAINCGFFETEIEVCRALAAFATKCKNFSRILYFYKNFINFIFFQKFYF